MLSIKNNNQIKINNKKIEKGNNLLKKLTYNDLLTSNMDKSPEVMKDIDKFYKKLSPEEKKYFNNAIKTKKIELSRNKIKNLLDAKNPLASNRKAIKDAHDVFKKILPEEECNQFIDESKKVRSSINKEKEEKILSNLNTITIEIMITNPQLIDDTEFWKHKIELSDKEATKFNDAFIKKAQELTKEAVPDFIKNLKFDNFHIPKIFPKYLTEDEYDKFIKDIKKQREILLGWV